MARIIGGIGTTHVPSIGKAIAEQQAERSLLEAVLRRLRLRPSAGSRREKPDVAVVFYNDHGLNFFLDKLPTFAVGAATEYRNEDEGWGIPVSHAVAGDAGALLAPDQRAGRRRVRHHHVPGHAGRSRLHHPAGADVAGRGDWPVKIVPVSINTVQHPLPSVARCLKLGRSVGRAHREPIRAGSQGAGVGTGGLSHQLDGERAGFINKEFDQLCMDKLVSDPDALTRYSIPQLVELAGAQGVELLNWMAMRGALTGTVSELHRNYHIPISNTAAATMLFENRPRAERRKAA